MFGAGIPVLFPLGLLGITVLYIVERVSLARAYKRPPRYSTELVESSVKVILLAPVLYSLGGFWMFSNR